MSEPPHLLEVARSLAVLHEVGRTCAQRWRERREAETARQARQARRREALVRRFDEEWREIEAGLEAAWEERKAAWERHAAARRERIEIAIDRARQALETALEEAAGRAKYRLQRDQLRNTRQTETALTEARRAHEQFEQELEAEEAVLETLEVRAAGLLSAYGGWRRLAARQTAPEELELPEEPSAQLEFLRQWLAQAEKAMGRLRLLFLPVVFRYVPWWLWLVFIVAGHAAAVYVLPEMGMAPWPLPAAVRSLGCWVGALLLLWLVGRQLGVGSVRRLGRALAAAHETAQRMRADAAARHAAQTARIEAHAAEVEAALQRDYEAALEEVRERRERETRLLEDRINALWARWEALAARRAAEIEAEHRSVRTARRAEWESRREAALADLDAEEAEAVREEQEAWEKQLTVWRREWDQAMAVVAAGEGTAPDWAPAWEDLARPDRPLPETMPRRVGVGRFEVSWSALWGELPAGFPLPGPKAASSVLPMALGLPDAGSVVVESDGRGRDAAVAVLEAMALRVLTALPPGRADFTLLDPVELGESFAALMHLADDNEQLINHRIWTQPAQIEDRLAELNGHIEKVTQMYLRNEYADIAEYNARAGRMAEKYRFLVVADFPHGFSELAVRRLQSILASGPKCGVFVWLHRDRRQPLPPELPEADLEQWCAVLRRTESGFRLSGAPAEGVEVRPDTPPPQEVETALLHKVGRASVDASRVEVPFDFVAPPREEFWSGDSTQGLTAPIGVTGATRRQLLSLGEGTRQHALIAGKTGSGKSNLFHVIIQSLALWYGPDEVEFYLVDFKKGVEFKCYARHRLPHARVVAIESDREFGLSVLRRVDEELRRRGELFRRLGVQDLAAYRRATGGEKLPRTLLIIDEFQEFFVEDDRIAQNAAMLLDRLVRQGRAFGIHVMLGSQTLGGAYTLARSTLGQMVVRIALQCNEADALLILDEDNPAPRLLSRPGEAIYNDAAGRIEGNSPFQIVFLEEPTREANLARIRQRAEAAGWGNRAPVVFEGNAPAEVAENRELTAALEATEAPAPAVPRVWLGAPNAIKGPTQAAFERQSGNHLLIVGQRDEAILAMLGVAAVGLAAQYAPGGVQVWALTRTPPDSAERRFWEKVREVAPASIRLAAGAAATEVWDKLGAELDRRLAGPEQAESTPPWFLLLHELHKFRELRQEDEFALSLDTDKTGTEPADVFRRLIEEGPAHGMHVICSCDSVSSLGRFLSRKLQGEFEMRVAFQMSANDSAVLIDSPQANLLGLHRAVFFDGREGILETFRPYALPGPEWLEQAAAALRRRAPGRLAS